MTLSRRSLITGLASLVAAPAIVRVGSIMPVKAIPVEWLDGEITPLLGPRHDLVEINEWLAECKRRLIDAMINPPRIVDANGLDCGPLRMNNEDFKIIFSEGGQRVEV